MQPGCRQIYTFFCIERALCRVDDIGMSLPQRLHGLTSHPTKSALDECPRPRKPLVLAGIEPIVRRPNITTQPTEMLEVGELMTEHVCVLEFQTISISNPNKRNRPTLTKTTTQRYLYHCLIINGQLQSNHL